MAFEPHDREPLITVDEYLARVLDGIEPLPAFEQPLIESLGLPVCQRITSTMDVPSFDNSSMDGYAVLHWDVRDASPEHPVELVVVGDVAAGSDEDPQIFPGTAVRVMTGAPVPSKADAVVPVEDTAEHRDAGRWVTPEDDAPTMHVSAAPVSGRFIRRAGEDAAEGSVVLAAGHVLSPAALASIAAAGFAEVQVTRRPRVVVVSTGSELVAPGFTPARGKIPDSNTELLAALIEEAGGSVVGRALVSDDPARLLEVLHALAPDDVDLVVLSGGVSAGAFDVVKEVLATEGSVTFARLGMQPGKPQGFGRLESGIRAFCLPGNPVSALVSFELFVRPALATMLGRRIVLERTLNGIAGAGWSSPAGRRQYIPVEVELDSGQGIVVRPSATGGSASHLVVSLAAAEGLAVVSAEVTEVRPGDAVGVLLLGDRPRRPRAYSPDGSARRY